ncbi:MAG TPA: hypothetical protein VGE39_01845, partial [Prosthecobacter sp.]
MNDDFAAAKPPSRWGNIFLALVLGGVVGAGALYVTKVDPSLLNKVPTPQTQKQTPADAPAPPTGEEAPVKIEHKGLPQTPFEMGALPADEPVETIKITLGVGTEGAALTEAVDVHLGLGFPLRLYPLGGIKREPSFGAFPYKSSLEGMATTIEPGQMATFEFSAKEDTTGLDALK